MYKHFHMRNEIRYSVLMHVFNIMILTVHSWEHAATLLNVYGKALRRFGKAYPALLPLHNLQRSTEQRESDYRYCKRVKYCIKWYFLLSYTGYTVHSVELNLVDYHLRLNFSIVLAQFKKVLRIENHHLGFYKDYVHR